MNQELMQLDFSPEQVALIKSQIAPQATPDELKLFLYQCKRTGLDPLTRQIYCIHRKVRNQDGSYSQKMTIITSIDGFRVIAERSGSYAGQDEPIFEYLENGSIRSCKVTVYKFSSNGTRYPAATGVAHWPEYVQEYNGKATGSWAKMPHVMISKVAEALALRKAFPQDLSGLYTGDEMPEDKTEPKQEVKAEPQKQYTTSYDKGKKPIITVLGFKKALQLAATDPTIYEKALDHYTMTQEQEEQLKNAYNANNVQDATILNHKK